MTDAQKPEQPDLDILLNELGAVSKETAKHPLTKSVKTPAPAAASPAAAQTKSLAKAPAKSVPGESIDDLLADIGKKNTPPAKPPTSTQSPQTDVNQNPKSGPPGDKAPPNVQPLTRRQLSPSTQSAELDKVLEQMQSKKSPAVRPGPQPVAQLGLSQTDLDSLVAKHANTPDPDSASEVIISQDDINSLVNQLTEVDEAGDQRQVITDILTKHTKTIDQLMRQQGGGKSSSVDALAATVLSEAAAQGQQSSPTMTVAATVGTQLAMPMFAPADMRGTRSLLAAAVILLALCAGTLMMMIKAIAGVSRELREEKVEAKLPEPTDDYSVDINAARTLLMSEDEAKAAKGVAQLEKLKKIYPTHELDLGLTIAKHYREHNDHRLAAAAYSSIIDRVEQIDDDPNIYLDYAESLQRAHDVGTAIRMVYVLLAKEDQYLSQQDDRGRTRTIEEISTNNAALQKAYLMLGRFLAEESELEPAKAPQPAQAEHAVHAHASESHS
jgi:hypothetical protein